MTLWCHCDSCGTTAPLAPGDKRPEGWAMWTERRGSEVSSGHRCPVCEGTEAGTSRARREVRARAKVAPSVTTGESKQGGLFG